MVLVKIPVCVSAFDSAEVVDAGALAVELSVLIDPTSGLYKLI